MTLLCLENAAKQLQIFEITISEVLISQATLLES